MQSRLVFSAFVLLLSQVPAWAQGGDSRYANTVVWTVEQVSAAKQGDKLALSLNGTVQPGWHVYGLSQAPDGPTPLLVSLDQNAIASAAGVVAGSVAIKKRDAAFGLDTQYYDSNFRITIPVQLKAHLAPGTQQIPLSVRFQACNGTICQPPTIVHVSASVDLRADG